MSKKPLEQIIVPVTSDLPTIHIKKSVTDINGLEVKNLEVEVSGVTLEECHQHLAIIKKAWKL